MGHNLLDHAKGHGVLGRMARLERKRYTGNRPTWIYIPCFKNVARQVSGYARGFAYQGEAYREGWRRAGTGFGAEYKRALTARAVDHAVALLMRRER